jgi:uncharacterized protein involved in exopolysaccharide biosynthesis
MKGPSMVDNNNIENQRSVRELLSIVFKHKGKILTMFLTVVLTATVLSVLKEPKYEAASKLLLKYGRENIYKSTSPSGEMVIDSSREERLNSTVEMLKGLNLAAEVLKDLGVQAVYPKLLEKPLASSQSASKLSPLDKAIPAFEKSLTVEAIPKSNIIEIRFQHEDPVIAARVVNKLVDVYLEHHINIFKDSGDYVFFDEQVKLYQKKLKDSEEELNQFKSTNNIFELQEQKKVLLNQISQLEIELAKTRGELNENAGKIRGLNASSATASENASMGQETDFNPYSISTLRNKLADLKMQEEKLLTNYNENSIAVVNIRQEIAKAKQLLDKEEKIYHDKAVASITQNLSSFKAKEISQQQHLEKFRGELNKINSAEMRLAGLERQNKLNEDNYQLYAKKLEEARISNVMDNQKIANISIIEPAVPPVKPVDSKFILILALAVILGLISGLVMAFSIEYYNHTFTHREDIEKHLDLPVLAAMPDIRK